MDLQCVLSPARRWLPLLLLAALLSTSGNEGRGAACPIAAEPTFESVAMVTSRETFERMQPVHRRMLAALVANNVREDATRVAACWQATPDQADVVAAFNSAITLGASDGGDFQTGMRWSSTATNGGGLGQGQPTTLRYSFVPDGTTVPPGTGEPGGVSNLFAWLNGIYGSPAVWQQVFHEEFQRWSDVTGLSYVHEPADDGTALFNAGGVIGVRGDVRIAAKAIDGNFNVLAYNFFPNGGDMVLDSSDSFFGNTGNDSRRLRNVVSHEHGHGIGLFHVCPDDGTKLMEPFANTVFLGPQSDDVQGGQRHYGDPYEPNDGAGSASDLGMLPDGSFTLENLSTDDDSDSDWFKLSVAGSRSIGVVLRPVGSTYPQGAQTGNCGAVTTPRNALTVANLGLELRGPSSSTVLASSTGGGLGQNETIAAFSLPGSGTYWIRVFPGVGNDVQLYELDVDVQTVAPQPFAIGFPQGTASSLVPDVTTAVAIDVGALTGNAPDVTSGLLHVSIDGGPWTSSPLVHLGGNAYEATLPALACLQRLAWYVTLVESGTGAVISGPLGAPDVTHVSNADQVTLLPFYADSFVGNTGWTVANDGSLTDGAWTRGTPVGGGGRGDPPSAFDADGMCWLTDNVFGNSDVDGGATILLSPVFDLSGHPDGRVSFSFWYDNDFGDNPGQDTFKIEVTANGSTWVRMETYGDSVDAWVQRTYRLKDFVTPSANVRFRFIADDPNPGAVVEAGVDAFSIEVCEGSLLGPAAVGFAGLFLGGPFDVLFVNGSAGGTSRGVQVPLGAPITFSVQPVPGAPSVPNFIIAGHPGIPAVSDAFPIGFLNGSLCFVPCLADPLNSPGFILADNILVSSPCPPLAPSFAAPWQITIPGIAFPFALTLQGVINDGFDLRTTNGVVLLNGM